MQGEICKAWQVFSISFELIVIQKLLGVFHLNTISSEVGIICQREWKGGRVVLYGKGGRVARGMQSFSKLYFCREGQTGIILYLRHQRVTRGPQKKIVRQCVKHWLGKMEWTLESLHSKFRYLLSSVCTQRGYNLYRSMKKLLNRTYFNLCIVGKLFTQ